MITLPTGIIPEVRIRSGRGYFSSNLAVHGSQGVSEAGRDSEFSSATKRQDLPVDVGAQVVEVVLLVEEVNRMLAVHLFAKLLDGLHQLLLAGDLSRSEGRVGGLGEDEALLLPLHGVELLEDGGGEELRLGLPEALLEPLLLLGDHELQLIDRGLGGLDQPQLVLLEVGRLNGQLSSGGDVDGPEDALPGGLELAAAQVLGDGGGTLRRPEEVEEVGEGLERRGRRLVEVVPADPDGDDGVDGRRVLPLEEPEAGGHVLGEVALRPVSGGEEQGAGEAIRRQDMAGEVDEGRLRLGRLVGGVVRRRGLLGLEGGPVLSHGEGEEACKN